MTPTPDTETLVALLEWYREAGVDWAVDESPHDRFAECVSEAAAAAATKVEEARPPAPRRASAAPSPAAPRGPADSPERGTSVETAERSAHELAAAAGDLDALRAAFEAFEGCSLKRTASRLVFSDGAADARVMLVGEAPGADEDRIGRPFVGRAGQLLDRMLAAIGLDRTQVYIANTVPWRPPGNRTPSPQETTVCMPFLRRQIALVNPDLLVAVGGASAQTLFGVKEGILRARGTWRRFAIEGDAGRREIAAIATLHPAYLLRSPGAKRLAWRDLREISRALDALPPR